MRTDRFVLGVNDGPRRMAMTWWSDFDRDERAPRGARRAAERRRAGAEHLWPQPPCDGGQHERLFGLRRPDPSLEPHARRLRAFAAQRPQVRPARLRVTLDVTPEAYGADRAGHARRLYRAYQSGQGAA